MDSSKFKVPTERLFTLQDRTVLGIMSQVLQSFVHLLIEISNWWSRGCWVSDYHIDPLIRGWCYTSWSPKRASSVGDSVSNSRCVDRSRNLRGDRCGGLSSRRFSQTSRYQCYGHVPHSPGLCSSDTKAREWRQHCINCEYEWLCCKQSMFSPAVTMSLLTVLKSEHSGI
jgi:hypothetical protein